MVLTPTARRSDPALLARRRSKTDRKITKHNREGEWVQPLYPARNHPISRFYQDYKLIPPLDRSVGKILAYPLEDRPNESKLYRRGVIVEACESYSTLLPIKTYSGRGCSHIQEEQETHSAVYVGHRPPSPRQEPSLRVAIRASRLDVENSAKPRINYIGRFDLDHNVKVREVGQVSGRHLKVLLKQYQEVHGIAQESAANPSLDLLDPWDAKPCTRVEDQEESGPQRNGDKNSANPARIQTSDLGAVHSLADTPQMQQHPKVIGSATTPQTPPNDLAGPSGATPLLSNENPTPPHEIHKANFSDPSLQQGSIEIPKTPHNDVENRPTSPPLVAESSNPVPSARPPPKSEQDVKLTQDDLLREAFPAGTTPPTVAVEALLPQGPHLTPTEAICPISDTISEEVTSAVDLSLSLTANTVSSPQAVSLGIQALPQMIGMFELHKETTRPTQEMNNAVQDLVKSQDMRHAFGYTVPSFSLQEMVTSLHVLSLTVYTNLLQMMDANLPQEPEMNARTPSAAAEKDKQHAEGGIPRLRLSLIILTLLLLSLLPLLPLLPLPLRLIILAIRLLYHLSKNRVTWFHRTRPYASMPPRPSARSSPLPDWWRWIWLQDEGLKSRIQVCALLDTGADDNFINDQALQRLDAKIDDYHDVVTCGNGQKQEVHGAVWLQFCLNSQPRRWKARFLVAAGLPYDVLFGRPLITRLEFFKVNPDMLVLTFGKNGKPDDKAVREAKKKEEQHDLQVEEQNKREREEIRARRAQAQQQPGA